MKEKKEYKIKKSDEIKLDLLLKKIEKNSKNVTDNQRRSNSK